MRTASILSFLAYLLLRSANANRIQAPSSRPTRPRPSHHDNGHDSSRVHEFALALRWTSELNRRLSLQQQQPQQQPQALQDSSSEDWLVPPPPKTTSPSSSSRLLVRGGDRSPPLPQQASNNDSEAASLFHAPHAHPHQTGAARWGPDLETSFVPRVLRLLQGSNNAVNTDQLLTLALVYLDRATSVSTPRSGTTETTAALPYCTPRTVHRLTLAALVLAHERVAAMSNNNNNTKNHEAAVERLALALGVDDLPELTTAMRQALGDFGTWVTPTQVQHAQQQQRERSARLRSLLVRSA